MFQWLRSTVFWGLLLIVAGVLFLLQAIFDIQFGSAFWGLILGAAGVLFLVGYSNNRMNWWALIPGCTLVGIGISILLGIIFPGMNDVFGGLFVLGGIGAGFIGIYLNDRRYWWAIIPAGVMITLALISLVENVLSDLATGGLLFFGIGVTFAVLALIRPPQGQMTWAWIPAIVLMVMGVLFSAAEAQLMAYAGPLLLILGGLFLILRVMVRRGPKESE